MSAPAIAIVGAGPAGMFTAQALRRALPDAAIDVIDRLPVPFGLLRYGVAPDHQGTKAIARQFERLFEREDVRFCGGVEIGHDIALEDLRKAYGVVVLAAGLAGDRRLGIPGDDLPGVLGSGHVTRWINDHPGAADNAPEFGSRIAIVGNGNVALDLARVLAKSGDEFSGSDLSPTIQARIAAACIEEITVIGRGTAQAARFDAALLKELARLGEAHVRVEMPAATGSETPVLAAFREIDGKGAALGAARRRLRFRFALTPVRIEPTGGTLALHLAPTDGAGAHEALMVDTIITAIGFESGASALPRDAFAPRDGALAPRLAPGLYAAGWFRRGPRGTIPDNRAEAKDVADRIVADSAAGVIPDATGRRPAALATAVSYAGWIAIRDHETATAPPGRVRLKCPTIAAMRAIAAGA